jgi:hypothetical protein
MADDPVRPGGEAKPLDVRISELENAVQKLTDQLQGGTGAAVSCRVCVECSCGPCADCSVCQVCRVCQVCQVCRICRICDPCYECSCGPCGR